MVLQLLRLFVRIQRWGNCSKDRSLFAAYFTDCRDTSTWVNTLFNYLAGIGKRCSLNCGRNRASHDLTSLHGPHEMQSKSWWNLFRKLTDNYWILSLIIERNQGLYINISNQWLDGMENIWSLGHDRISFDHWVMTGFHYTAKIWARLSSSCLHSFEIYLVFYSLVYFFRFWYVYARQQWVSPRTQRIVPFS